MLSGCPDNSMLKENQRNRSVRGGDPIDLLRALASVGEQLINNALKLFEVIALSCEMAVPFHAQHFRVTGTP